MKLLVTGCGSIGLRHLQNLQGFPGVDIAAFDVSKSRLAEIQDELKIPCYDNLDRALEQGYDGVIVCAPNHLHLEIANKALDAGSHLFIEKPIAHNLVGIDQLAARAEKAGKIVLVGCNMRFHPPVRQMQEWINKGIIGRIQFLRLRYGNYLPNWRPTDYRESYSAQANQGGGIILDAIHELDIAEMWMGKVQSVFCSAGKFSDLEIEVEDTAEILLRGDKENIAEIHIDYLRPERARTYEIIGSKGMIRWMGTGKNPEFCDVGYYLTEEAEWHSQQYHADLNEMYIEEMKHFLRCIEGKDQPVQDALRGGNMLRLAFAAKDSAEQHREVGL